VHGTVALQSGPDLLKPGPCSEKNVGPHGRPQEFLQGGNQGFWGRNSPSGVQGWSPGGSLGAKPPEADGILLKMTYTDIAFLMWGPIFVGAPVRPNMLNMPKSASESGENFRVRRHICYSANMLSPVRLSVCLSVTRVDQSKTLEVRIMQLSPLSSPMTLVSSWLNFTPKFLGEHRERGRQIREGKENTLF